MLCPWWQERSITSPQDLYQLTKPLLDHEEMDEEERQASSLAGKFGIALGVKSLSIFVPDTLLVIAASGTYILVCE